LVWREKSNQHGKSWQFGKRAVYRLNCHKSTITPDFPAVVRERVKGFEPSTYSLGKYPKQAQTTVFTSLFFSDLQCSTSYAKRAKVASNAVDIGTCQKSKRYGTLTLDNDCFQPRSDEVAGTNKPLCPSLALDQGRKIWFTHRGDKPSFGVPR
jgi:hypothetical protein